MTPHQLDDIPDRLLNQRDASELSKWLEDRNQRMTLEQLDQERRRRGITRAWA